MDLKSIIFDYLSKAQMMQLGTSHNNQPWVTTVYFAYDANLNLYWLSNPSRRHSEEIKKNSKVGGSIVMMHNYGDKVRGLQFEGEARKLDGPDAELAVNIYKSRYWIVESRATNEPGPQDTCYQLHPKKFTLYDEINFPQNPSQVLEI